MEGLYAEAKPHQDAIVEISTDMLEGSREVFRRIIVKTLQPLEVPFTETRIVTRLSCSLNCLGQPALELQRRLNKFKEEGVRITKVEFDTVLHEFIFHTAIAVKTEVPLP